MTEPNRRWTKERLQELNLILWALWDPIGSGVPLDEYESYAPKLATLLEGGADVDVIAKTLSQVRTDSMGLKRGSKRDREAALKIVHWFRTGEHPGFEANPYDE